MKRTLLLGVGFVSLGFGMIGVVIPLLPTVPFLMLSAWCFARGSKKVNDWFKKTKIYKTYLDSYVKGEGMSIKTKVSIMAMVTLLLSIGFISMHKVPLAQSFLFIIWLGHLLVLSFKVKTLKKEVR